MIRGGSLFSGSLGLDLGLEAAGVEFAWACENDAACRRVIAARRPGLPVFTDVRDIDASAPPVDLLAGGFPCQDLSYAGLGAGLDGERSGLWHEFARAVRVLRPRLVLVENVPGLATRGLGRVLYDLAAAGYVGQWLRLRAADVGAPHRRERIFILASATDAEREQLRVGAGGVPRSPGAGEGEGPERQRLRADARDGGAPAADADGERERQLGGLRGGEQRRTADGRDAAPADADDERGDGERGTRRGRRQPAGGRSEAPADSAGGRRRRRQDREPGDSAVGQEAERGEGLDQPAGGGDAPRFEWGAYEPAVRRWEHLSGRAAPAPVDGRGGLAPAFVEWMLGYPAGWTEVAGVSKTQRLRMLGNSVQVQCGELAGRLLIEGSNP